MPAPVQAVQGREDVRWARRRVPQLRKTVVWCPAGVGEGMPVRLCSCEGQGAAGDEESEEGQSDRAGDGVATRVVAHDGPAWRSPSEGAAAGECETGASEGAAVY